MIGQFIHTYLKLFFLLTPFFVISTFLGLTDGMPGRQRRQIALRTAVAVILLTVGVYLLGNPIFRVFGITLDAFRIGAGALLFLSAISLVSGRGEQRAADEGEDIAVVPLAIPITVGPGTVGALLVLGSELTQQYGSDLRMQAASVAGMSLAAATVGVLLVGAASAGRFLSPRIMSVLTKLTGLIVSSIAAQLIFTGVRNFLH